MPKVPDDKKREAEKMFMKGASLVDIAKNLGVSDSTVRSWKRRYGWTEKPKKNESNVAKKSATKKKQAPKKKSGGQPGNLNAVGGRGNPHPNPPPDATKHGVYRNPVFEKLSEEEKEMYYAISDDPEVKMIDELRLLALRESWIVDAINKYRAQNGEVTVLDVTRIDNKRAFASDEEEAEYKKKMREKIRKGERLPGDGYQLQTHTVNKDSVLQRWSQELSTVQGRMEKILADLAKIHLEKQKLESESIGSEAVDDWIAGIMGGDADE